MNEDADETPSVGPVDGKFSYKNEPMEASLRAWLLCASYATRNSHITSTLKFHLNAKHIQLHWSVGFG